MEKKAKALLINRMLRRGMISNDMVLINEFALDSFSRRADLVLVNSNIEIFEIKSDADNLLRLSGQVETFARYCDKMHVVAATRHINDILISTPHEVAVWELDEAGNIKVVRKGKKKKLKDKESLIKLINLRELKQLLRNNGIKCGIQRRKHLEAAALKLSLLKVRTGVLTLLKDRYEYTTKRFLAKAIKVDSVKIEHLAELKRTRTNLGQQKNLTPTYNSDIFMSQMSMGSETCLFGNPPKDIVKLLQ